MENARTDLVDGAVEIVPHDAVGYADRVFASTDKQTTSSHQLELAHQSLRKVGTVHRHRYLSVNQLNSIN